MLVRFNLFCFLLLKYSKPYYSVIDFFSKFRKVVTNLRISKHSYALDDVRD